MQKECWERRSNRQLDDYAEMVVVLREVEETGEGDGLLHQRMLSVRAMVDCWQRRSKKWLLHRNYRWYAEEVDVGVGEAGEAGKVREEGDVGMVAGLLHRRMILVQAMVDQRW